MRTIKFRGKSILSAEWVYGGITAMKDGWCSAITTLTEDEFDSRELVYPETIGQFTGLIDKNGNKIYEGDVIKCGLRLYVCEFIEGGFEFRDLSDANLVLKAIVNNSCIIGNIHDNPELLKGE